MAEKTLKVDGMSCQHCVMALQKNFQMLDGVTDTNVEVGKATVTYDEGKVSDAQFDEAVTKAGFKLA